jgi:hypothetical protein
VDKYSLKFRSVENELNTLACDNEVANIINTGNSQHQQNQHQTNVEKDKHLIDFHSIDPPSSSGVPGSRKHSSNEQSSQSSTSTTTMNVNGVNVCHDCECCRVWEREYRSLVERMRVLETTYSLTPEVVNWFDKLKSVIKPHMELSDLSSLSVSNLSLNQIENSNNNNSNTNSSANNNGLNGSATKSSDTIVETTNSSSSSSSAAKISNDKSAVPEIVIENIV